MDVLLGDIEFETAVYELLQNSEVPVSRLCIAARRYSIRASARNPRQI